MKGFQFRFIVLLILIFSAAELSAQNVYLCVWRNPERTMTRLFPKADDYRTVNVDISPEARAEIEKTMGFELLPGQQESFQYFEMLDKDSRQLGVVIAASQKGEYGAVEFVVGVDNQNRIVGMYIQRSRERDRSFKKKEFLEQFTGRLIAPVSELGEAAGGNDSPGSRAVVRGLQKEFTSYLHLVAGSIKENSD